MSEEIKAAITVAELMRPVWYRGEGPAGHIFSDSVRLLPTHVFETIEQGREHFAGRTIHDLPTSPDAPPVRQDARPDLAASPSEYRAAHRTT